ncbi:unnamed protein product [Eruca vesicaria subsp. sativa]|uniref:BZIP domain-containing protein n=1 Tax=Eruca vesicaria subsp. sativa TaxID=29727 RepID=A0ABC8KGC3_ERUVS|nr:unnamed protein product [Eruca vesicaria subsp. sativa]
MNRHPEIAPYQTSFVLSTQFPCSHSGKRGSMSPPPRSSLPPRPPPTSKQNDLQNFNPGPRLSQPVFSFGSLPPMSPATSPFAFTRPTTSSSDNYSAGLHSMLPQDAMQMIYAKPIEMPVGPGEKEPHGEVASFMDDYVTAYMELDKNFDFSNRDDDVERISSGYFENVKSSTGSANRGNSTLGVKKWVFTESQMKKIAGCERLRKLVVADPKYVKRLLSSRETGERARKKKAQQVLELEKTINILEKEAARVTALNSSAERTKLSLEEENMQIRIRLQEMEEQAKLANALTEYYNGEINRLKQKGTGVLNPNMETLMYENMLMEQLSLDEEPETNYGFE